MNQPAPCSHRMSLLLAVAMAVSRIAPADAQDQLVPIVNTSGFLDPGTSPAAFAYDPTTDTMFVTSDNNPALVKVTNVSSAAQIATPTVYKTTIQLYYTDGNPNRGVTSPVPGGLLLNPKPVGANAPYSFALVTDGATTRFAPDPVTGSQPTDPSATKRVYLYNLGTAAIPGNGTDVFTTRVTLADMQAQAGNDGTSSFVQRQFAWSGDGQSIYFVNSSGGQPGLWAVGALAGAPRQLLVGVVADSEPGVRSANGIDSVYFSSGAGETNAGGINFVTDDGVTTSPVQVGVSVEKLADFFEVPGMMSSTQRARSIAFQGDDMYFCFFNTSSGFNSRYQGIYRLDAAGRLTKVANRTERTALLGPVTQTFDHLQPRTITYTGTAGSFAVTQLLYREVGPKMVAGAIAFKPGDFNRDNAVTSADIALFKPQVTASGTANVKTIVADLKFDMNGNDIVSWKDVQILEQFLDYVPAPELAGRVVPELTIKADTNLDGIVDFADFRIMRDNYAPAVGNRTFLVGDSSGDDRVDFADLQPWVNSDGYRSAVIGAGVPTTPFNKVEFDAFLATLTPPDVVLDVASGTSTQFEKGYRSIVIAASVTKTGSGAVVFDGVNSYSGTTTVAAGSLIVDPAGTFGASPLVDVRAGATLDVSRVAGGLVVANGQTLGGSGTVVGDVVFGRGTTLSPGAFFSLGSLAAASLPAAEPFTTAILTVPEPALGPLATLAALAGMAIGTSARHRQPRPTRRHAFLPILR